MEELNSIYLAYAQIAGVFVGFGALISFSDKGQKDTVEYAAVVAVVLIGLLLILVSLTPIALSRFALEPQYIWRISAALFLGLDFIATFVPVFFLPDGKKNQADFVREYPKSMATLYLLLTLPLYAMLAMVVLNFMPQFHSAIYTFALSFYVLQAALFMTLLVFRNAPKTDLDG